MLNKVWNAFLRLLRAVWAWLWKNPRRLYAVPVLACVAAPLLHAFYISLHLLPFWWATGRDPLVSKDAFREFAWTAPAAPSTATS